MKTNRTDSDWQGGFSLVGVMVAAALMGGLAMGLMKIFEGQNRVQKRAEASMEITSMASVITQHLLSGGGCTETIGVGTRIVNNTPITAIKNKSGTEIYNTFDTYQQVKMKSATIKNVSLTPGAGTSKFGTLDLEVEFERTSKILQGNRIVKKKFPIKVETDMANKLIKCYSATEDAVETSKVEVCSDLNGTWDAANDKCVMRHFGKTCGANERLRGFDAMGEPVCEPMSGSGCKHPKSWYCSCSRDGNGTKGSVVGCVHCNAQGLVDNYWMGHMQITSSGGHCPASPNPPGPDPVHSYITN